MVKKTGKQYRLPNKLESVVLGVAVFLAITVIFQILLRKNSTEQPNTSNSSYTQEYTDNFMKACTAEGASSSYCRCALNVIKTTYTYDQVLVYEKTNYPGDLQLRVPKICQKSL